MKILCLMLTGLTVLVTASISTAAQVTMNWTVDGEAREALVFAPAPATVSIKHPLVFAFHGHFADMNEASQSMHIQVLWPGAIVVYPQGKHRPGPIDPQGNANGWQVEANQTNGNVGNKDLVFLTRCWPPCIRNSSLTTSVFTPPVSQAERSSAICSGLNALAR